MDIEKDFEYWEQHSDKIQEHIESFILSNNKEDINYAYIFLNTLDSNKEYYPNLAKALQNEIELNNHIGLRKADYLKYQIECKIFDEYNAENFEKLKKYKENHINLFNKYIKEYFSDELLYNKMINFIGFHIADLVKESEKVSEYINYLNFIIDNTFSDLDFRLSNFIKHIYTNETDVIQAQILDYCIKDTKISNQCKRTNLSILQNDKRFISNNTYFQIQYNNDRIGIQTWKVHIPIDNQIILNRIINILINEFNLGTLNTIKFVNPDKIITKEQLELNSSLINDKTYGKEITIYLDMRSNLLNCSDDFKALFYLNAQRCYKGDIHFGGLIYGEYALGRSFFNKTRLINGKGAFVNINIENMKALVKESTLNDIINLPSNIYNDYQTTNDWKRYIQNLLLFQRSSSDDIYLFTEVYSHAENKSLIEKSLKQFLATYPEYYFQYMFLDDENCCYLISEIRNERILQYFKNYFNEQNTQVFLYDIPQENYTLNFPLNHIDYKKTQFAETQLLTSDMKFV